MKQMFPTRSRLQVAIALEKLNDAALKVADAWAEAEFDHDLPRCKYLRWLFYAIMYRLKFIYRSVLYAPLSKYHVARLPSIYTSQTRGRAREFRL